MQVRAKVDCFLADGSYRKAGEVFEYEGAKNQNLEPYKKSAEQTSETETKDGE